jgi:hypothetical protein
MDFGTPMQKRQSSHSPHSGRARATTMSKTLKKPSSGISGTEPQWDSSTATPDQFRGSRQSIESCSDRSRTALRLRVKLPALELRGPRVPVPSPLAHSAPPAACCWSPLLASIHAGCFSGGKEPHRRLSLRTMPRVKVRRSRVPPPPPP